MFPEQVHLVLAIANVALRKDLRNLLSTTRFNLEETPGSDHAVKTIRSGVYNLVLIGLCPQDPGAIETCRILRGMRPRVGVAIVQDGGSPEDEVRALEAGADDCISPPFRFREMVARLGAILRCLPVDASQPNGALRAGSIEVDVQRRLCRRSGLKVHLSPKEFELLVYLMRNPEIALPHTKLMRAVWGHDTRRERMYLRSYVKSLRRKIEGDPAKPQYILTEPWVGYRFHNPYRGDSWPKPTDDKPR